MILDNLQIFFDLMNRMQKSNEETVRVLFEQSVEARERTYKMMDELFSVGSRVEAKIEAPEPTATTSVGEVINHQ